ncbi:hypothetical protein G6L15_06895 [Agrobacterium rhizogenes]|uniref:hypothetical protein n=1 Tax=Rhizobium rhizogenes TaxID=359 RepID=UPI001573326A|nr:hypothetical protein [Rhizobium rhizogenes]NTG85874.1 hypothetical protein [Rhizobium rhizogenes]
MRVPRRLAGIGAADLPNAAAFDAYVGPSREVTVDPVRGLLKLHDGTTPGGLSLFGATVTTIATRAALAAVDTTATKTIYLKEAGREGLFQWNTGDFSAQIAADSAQGLYVKATAIAATAGSWARVRGNSIFPEWFGAVGDNTTNDTSSIQNALNVAPLAALFGQRVVISQKYLCDSLTIPAGVALEGNNPALGDLIPGGDTYSFSSQLRLRSGATITLGRSSVIQSLVCVRDGLLATVSTDAQATTLLTQFAGTAISMPERDAIARGLLVLGFDRGVQSIASTTNEGRTIIENCRFDCKNPVFISGWYDIPKLRHCHAWPFLTAHVTGLSQANLCRNGAGYQLDGVNDWMTAFDCFSYGHQYGFRITGAASNVCLLRCQADHSGAAGASTAGISVEDTANTTRILACTVISHLIGVRHTTTHATRTEVGDCLFSTQDVCIDHLSGRMQVRDCQFNSGTNGVRTSSSITGGDYKGNYFSGLSSASYNINSTTASVVRIDGSSPSISTTAAVASGSGTITTATANLSYALYETAGRAWVECDIDVVITTNGTGATSIQVTLPWTSNINRTFVGSQESVGGAECIFKVNSGSNVLTIVKYDNTYPGATGVTLRGKINIRLP